MCVCARARARVCVCVCVCAAFLSSSIQAFAQLFQSNPEKRTLELDGNEAMAGQKVVLMSVPSNEDHLLKGKVRGGLQNVLKGAVSGSTVALPLKLSVDIPATKSAKIISFGIVEILDDEKFQGRDILLKLYLEHVTAAERNEICECIDNFLAKKNWATRGCCSKSFICFFNFLPLPLPLSMCLTLCGGDVRSCIL